MATEEAGRLVAWEAQPKQAAFIACPCDDVAFGGARGGGKSDAVVGDWLDHESRYGEHAIGMVFRRERTQLVEFIERARQVLVPQGHAWKEQDKYFRSPRGGRLRFSYLEHDSDADAYQGHSYTRLYPEEMGTFPREAPIAKLSATLRSGHGVPCRMKGTCNPGGPGHSWVRRRYTMDRFPLGNQVVEFEYENPFTRERVTKTRVFIPSRVTDNRYLGSDYVANLFQVGSEKLVRAWLEGDWTAVEGAYFEEFSAERHVLEPFQIPEHWARFRACDWGSARPFCVQWLAVVGDDERVQGRWLPRGALVVYREWYGSRTHDDVGLKLTAEEVAAGIRLLEERDPKMAYGVMDPSAFAQDGGPSIAERMADAPNRVYWRPADNARVAQRGKMGGWDALRERLKGGIDGRPMLYVLSTCEDLIRTLPALQHDESRPEDVDTDSEDHSPDCLRYACMSRPFVGRADPDDAPRHVEVGPGNRATLEDLFKDYDKRQTWRRRVERV